MFRRAPYEKVLHDWPRIAPCYPYRNKLENETDHEYGHRAARELDEAIRMAGPDNVAAFIAEPVAGATLGVVPAVPGYFEEIRRICDHHHVLFIADEVMCGSGRCGTFYAHDQEDVVPDMVSIAKGLGGGYQPIGAVIARNFICEAIRDDTSAFAHGHTYIGHAIACAAGVAIQKCLDDGLLASVAGKGERLMTVLNKRFGDHPHVGDIRGRGLFVGLEFVSDRKSKTAFPVENGIPGKLKNAAMENGLICYPGGGTVDGRKGAHLLLAPPFIAEDQHFEELADRLDKMLQAVFTQVTASFIVMCAPNGARKTKGDHPALPISPAELATCAETIVDAGASIIHVHVRDEHGGHSLDVDRYRNATSAIRKTVGDRLVIQATTEACGIYEPEQQIAMVRALKPEAVSVALREFCPDSESETDAAEFYAWMNAERIMAQHILYSPEEVSRFESLRERGVICDERPFVLYVLGRYTTDLTGDIAELGRFVDKGSADTSWAVCCFGATESKAAGLAAAKGGHARVGFENNLLLPNGEQANDNAELVCIAAAEATAQERTLATADDVRSWFAGPS